MEKKYNTLKYYNENAEVYCEQTLILNIQDNYDKFLKHLSKDAYILDFGCGSGRDSKYFIEKGYKVKAIDGSDQMCKFARKYIDQEVTCMNFEELNDINTYDAIWACSSILHVEKENLPNILLKMINAVKPNGIIYASFKIGTGYEIQNGKYYNYLTKKDMVQLLKGINEDIKIIDYFETLPSIKRSARDLLWEISL